MGPDGPAYCFGSFRGIDPEFDPHFPFPKGDTNRPGRGAKKENLCMKLWTGRFHKELDKTTNDFNSSISFDSRMAREDIT